MKINIGLMEASLSFVVKIFFKVYGQIFTIIIVQKANLCAFHINYRLSYISVGFYYALIPEGT